MCSRWYGHRQGKALFKNMFQHLYVTRIFFYISGIEFIDLVLTFDSKPICNPPFAFIVKKGTHFYYSTYCKPVFLTPPTKTLALSATGFQKLPLLYVHRSVSGLRGLETIFISVIFLFFFFLVFLIINRVSLISIVF